MGALSKIALTMILAAGIMGATQAETVPIRSGEHRTFSRLVFADAPGRDWSVSRDGLSRVFVTFSAGVPQLDPSSIFDLIPRTRIADVAYDAQILELKLVCDCSVEVFQIPTGHVVVDVRDGPPIPLSAAISKTQGLPVHLPLQEIPFEVAGRKPSHSNEPPVVEMRETEPGPVQVLFHPSGVVALIRTTSDDPRPIAASASCEIEDLAGDALLANPIEARTALAEQLSQLLDGEDRLDSNAVRRLALGYLAAGWGAEAEQTATLAGIDDGAIALVAAALDGVSMAGRDRLDPGCGPASAALALLDIGGTDRWDRANLDELSRFLDRMHPFTWLNVEPRIRLRLIELGDEVVLAGLGADPTPEPLVKGADDRFAAGTDASSIDAAIRLLSQSNMVGEAAAELHIVNAMALLPSVPSGDRRLRLEQALAEAFVLSNRPSEAIAMVADRRARGETLLALALDNLAEPVAAEFAVRLQPFLAPGSASGLRAAELFLRFGLAETAIGFEEPVIDLPKVSPAREVAMSDPWLMRDFPALADVDIEVSTPRNDFARAVLSRNTTPLPQTDLAAAGEILTRSRALNEILTDLLSVDGTG